MSVLVLTPRDLQGLVGMKEAIDIVEQGFREAAAYPIISAPRRRVHSPDGVRISNFPGGIHGLGVIGSLTISQLVTQTESNQTYAYREHPVHVLFDSKAGRLLAILIGEIDDKTLGYTSLAALPTAATSGVGFRYLVRKDAHTVGLFGSAGQAANQLLALTCERPITHVKVYSRNPDNRRRFAETYSEKFGIEITPVDSPREVVRGVDVILCATNTSVPLFDGNWLEPGQHVTGMIGSNVHLVHGGFIKQRRRELDDTTAVRADVIVCNLRELVVQDEQGDLFEPMERGLIQLDDIGELGDLAAGSFPGRTNDRQITYHKNNSVIGISFMGIAMRAYERASSQGHGVKIDLPTPGE